MFSRTIGWGHKIYLLVATRGFWDLFMDCEASLWLPILYSVPYFCRTKAKFCILIPDRFVILTVCWLFFLVDNTIVDVNNKLWSRPKFLKHTFCPEDLLDEVRPPFVLQQGRSSLFFYRHSTSIKSSNMYFFNLNANFLPDWCTAGVSIHCLRGWLLERFRDVTRAISPNKSSIKSIPPNHTDRNRDNEYWCLGNIGFWQIDDALCGCIFSPLEVIALIIGHYAHYADGSSI